MDCITVENMRISDQRTIQERIPSLTLMRRAAAGIRLAHSYDGKTVIAVGSGNNGGDGFALAEILAEEGKPVTVLTVSDHLSPDSTWYMHRAKIAGAEVLPYVPGTSQLAGADTVADCLLGTGFSGDVRGKYADMIREINGSSAFVVSADINSGMNGDSGEGSLIVSSDLTVTIGYVKIGLVKACAQAFMKKLCVTDIGIELVRQEDEILSPDVFRELERQKTTEVLTLEDDTRYIERSGRRSFQPPAALDMHAIMSR